MSEQKVGFYFSCNADKSAHDHTVYVTQGNGNYVVLGARYKNSEASSLYEMMMDPEDLLAFGQMCINLATALRQSDKEGK